MIGGFQNSPVILASSPGISMAGITVNTALNNSKPPGNLRSSGRSTTPMRLKICNGTVS